MRRIKLEDAMDASAISKTRGVIVSGNPSSSTNADVPSLTQIADKPSKLSHLVCGEPTISARPCTPNAQSNRQLPFKSCWAAKRNWICSRVTLEVDKSGNSLSPKNSTPVVGMLVLVLVYRLPSPKSLGFRRRSVCSFQGASEVALSGS